MNPVHIFDEHSSLLMNTDQMEDGSLEIRKTQNISLLMIYLMECVTQGLRCLENESDESSMKIPNPKLFVR